MCQNQYRCLHASLPTQITCIYVLDVYPYTCKCIRIYTYLHVTPITKDTLRIVEVVVRQIHERTARIPLYVIINRTKQHGPYKRRHGPRIGNSSLGVGGQQRQRLQSTAGLKLKCRNVEGFLHGGHFPFRTVMLQPLTCEFKDSETRKHKHSCPTCI